MDQRLAQQMTINPTLKRLLREETAAKSSGVLRLSRKRTGVILSPHKHKTETNIVATDTKLKEDHARRVIARLRGVDPFIGALYSKAKQKAAARRNAKMKLNAYAFGAPVGMNGPGGGGDQG